MLRLVGDLIRWHVRRMSNARTISDRKAARRVARGDLTRTGARVGGFANWLVGALAVFAAVLFFLAAFGL